MGWLVHVACCHKGDDILRIPTSAHYYDERQLCNPFHRKWAGYLLRGTIEDCPGVTYRVMSEVIRDYVNPYAVMNNILQDACNHAKAVHLANQTTTSGMHTPFKRLFETWDMSVISSSLVVAMSFEWFEQSSSRRN
jgi:hypothetical protein